MKNLHNEPKNVAIDACEFRQISPVLAQMICEVQQETLRFLPVYKKTNFAHSDCKEKTETNLRVMCCKIYRNVSCPRGTR
uniref:Uncharacterized protein n=1 Tax=Romanomermis culicivorax TaxID=13658 RepID=A0A915KA96_ROMCU